MAPVRATFLHGSVATIPPTTISADLRLVTKSLGLPLLVEELFKAGDEAARQKWIDCAKKYLTDRNLTRVISGFSRLQGECDA